MNSYENLGSFKVLENVHLKATYNMEINGTQFKTGESIAIFDKIQISSFNEIKEYVAARGGYDNRGHVFWETTRSMQFTFSQGVFSQSQFGILNNAKVIKIENEEPLLITFDDEIESDEVGALRPTKVPYDQIFCYNKATGARIECQPWGGAVYKISEPYTDVIMRYRYNYTNGASVAKIGQQFLSGFLELEGKTRVKDDTSGLITTGIIKIPKLKLMSGLSMRLGAQANPVVGTFQAEGVPVDSRRNSYVMEIYFLDEDIDSDM